MASISDILSCPRWMPQQIDPSSGRVLFVLFARHQFASHDFLANQQGEDQQWVSISDLRSEHLQKGPVHYIFHSGFCRSTLLLRALNLEGKVLGLNEPEILNDLARLTDPSDALIGLVVDLLSRPHAAGETILIKPSNFPNRLIPTLMRVRNDTNAILLTNTLEEFLWAIVRKGLLGRQWGRQTYLIAAAYSGESSGYDALIPSMTDLQVAALGWLLMQNWFATSQRKIETSRSAILHSDFFDRNRAITISASAAHLKLGLEQGEIDAILAGQVFATDAKTGAAYATKEALDSKRSFSAVTEQEISEICTWIDELARVSGLSIPLAQSLC